MEPGRLDDESVNLPKLGQADELAGRPVRSLNGLGVDPLRSFRVPLDLEVLGELLVSDRLSLAEEPLDLLEDERVAFDRRGVVRLRVPDALPDRICLEGKRQPLNFLRIEQSTRLVAIGTIVGAILPMVLIIGLAFACFAKGGSSAIPFSADKPLPDFSGQQLILLGGILLTFAGVEMAGYHARETRNPRRDYPRAMLLGAVIIVTFSLLGSLAVALVVPEKQISLLSGTMQAFKDMLDAIGVGWLVKPVAIIIVLGGVAHLSPWIIGPAKGIAAVARRGYLPPAMGRLSRNQIPTTGLIVQAIGGTLFSLLFLFLPNANTSYGILTAMTAQVIIVMYVLMFSALIRLRYSQPEVDRSYRLPGGKPGAWLICGAGIFGCAFAFVAGFFPPGDWDTWDTGQKITYYAIVIGGFILLTLPPFFARIVKRDGWPVLAEDEGAVLEPSPAPAE